MRYGATLDAAAGDGLIGGGPKKQKAAKDKDGAPPPKATRTQPPRDAKTPEGKKRPDTGMVRDELLLSLRCLGSEE